MNLIKAGLCKVCKRFLATEKEVEYLLTKVSGLKITTHSPPTVPYNFKTNWRTWRADLGRAIAALLDSRNVWRDLSLNSYWSAEYSPLCS